jgi:hypothetical protein
VQGRVSVGFLAVFLATAFLLRGGTLLGCGAHLSATASRTAPAASAAGCNGLASNCQRTYDQVAIAATHDAFSYAAGGPVDYRFANQDRPIADQLEAGIRGLGLRPCPYFGLDPTQANRVYVTHNSLLIGALGEEPLDGILRDIKQFLDRNPREVVTVYMESTVTAAQVAATFDAAGLTPYLFVLEPGRGWPTLDSMISAGTRLVAFNDSQDASRPPWMLYLWDQIVDTDYDVTDPSQFRCAFHRGAPGNPIYFLNEFVYERTLGGLPAPSSAHARVVNAPDFITSRASQCLGETGRAAAVVYVDWFGQGDVVAAVNALNRARNAPPGPPFLEPPVTSSLPARWAPAKTD